MRTVRDTDSSAVPGRGRRSLRKAFEALRRRGGLVLACFLLLFAGVVYLIIKTVSFGKATSKGEMNLLTQGTDGSTYISSDAISTMVQRLLHRNRQIRSASCSVTPVSDGITIDIRLTVLAGGDYAQLCSDIQRDIKQEVEQATGIPVKNVSVSIIKTIVPNGEQAPVEKRVK